MRLVGIRVADRGQDRELALAVQRVERRCRGMPAQAGVLREDEARVGQCELRAQSPVLGVAVREEQRERIGAAVQEDRDEHGVGPAGGERLGDALVEHLAARARFRRRPRSRARPSGRGSSGGRGRSPPGAASRARSPGSPAPASATAFRSRDGTRELVAAVSHDVCKSGEMAIRWRSAFSISGRVLRLLPAPSASPTARVANDLSARRVVEVSGGLPQNSSARSRSLFGSSGALLRGLEDGGAEHVAGDVPAGEERSRVEPAVVVPAGDVRRIEELLAGLVREPGPGLGVDSALPRAEHPGQVDDGWLDHSRPRVEARVAQDRLDDGPGREPACDVELLQRPSRRRRRRRGDEVAPELADEERAVLRMADGEPARVLPVEAPALAEDPLLARIVALLVVAEVDRALVVVPVVRKPVSARACSRTSRSV